MRVLTRCVLVAALVVGVASPASAYTIRPGDTLSQIAARYHLTVAQLAAANGLTNPNLIMAGAPLVIPSGEATPIPGPPSATPLAIATGFRCPVAGPHRFGDDWGAWRAGGRRHLGTDVMAPRGTPIIAPVSGYVVPRPNHLGGNAFSLLGSDGNRYYGAHMERYGASGQVRAGTVIGYVGDTGDAKGGPTHLHFEIHPHGGTATDPYPTLRAAC